MYKTHMLGKRFGGQECQPPFENVSGKENERLWQRNIRLENKKLYDVPGHVKQEVE